MSILLLNTLVVVADSGSFTAAAQALSVSPAAIGQQMKRLETDLGTVLFDRSATSVQLNARALAVLPRARELVRSYHGLLDDLPGDAHWQGEFVLGAVPSTIRGLVPVSVKALMAEMPGLRIRVVPGLTQDLLEQVERGAIDAAVLSDPGRVAATLDWVPCVDEPLVLLANADVVDDDVNALLSSQPYIRHTRRAAVGELADEWLAANDVSVNTAMEMESLESVASMVAHGLGVSIAPDLCVPDPIFASLNKLPLYPAARARSLGLVSRKDSAVRRLVMRLETVVQTVVEAAGQKSVSSGRIKQ